MGQAHGLRRTLRLPLWGRPPACGGLRARPFIHPALSQSAEARACIACPLSPPPELSERNGLKFVFSSNTSTPSTRFSPFTTAYVAGVINASYSTLPMYPDPIIVSIVGMLADPAKIMVITSTVSTNCPTAVDPIVRIHRCLPRVASFIFAITYAFVNSPAQ